MFVISTTDGKIMTAMLKEIEEQSYKETLGLQQILHLSRQDLNFTSKGIINDDFLSRYSREEQIKILSLDAFITERVRQILIEQISSECSQIGVPNLYLRGSGATGLFPFGDLDISHYGPTDLYTPKVWPQKIINQPVSWGHVSQEELKDCVSTSLRMASSLLEAQPMTKTDPQVAETVGASKNTIMREGKFYYLLFRQFEEQRLELPWKKWQQPPDEYSGRKEMPGGKRTIQRICWSLQVLYPELSETINPNVLLMQAYYRKLIPFEVVSSAFRIMRMIRSDLYIPEAFSQSAHMIHDWYIDSLVPQINQGLADNTPYDYLHKIRKAFALYTNPSDFKSIIEFAENQDVNYQQWLMLWVTSHNTSCPPDDLYHLWSNYLGRTAYRNMLRNLLRNPSFPIERVTRRETEYDPHLLECYDTAVNKLV